MEKPGGRSFDVVYRRKATSELGGNDLGAIRDLLRLAFDGDFSDEDWDHALGGVHVTAHRGSDLVGHGSVVPRRFLHQDRVLRAGYVEAVAVHQAHRSVGVGRGLMDIIVSVIDDDYELGALSATGPALDFYEHIEWERWAGTTQVLGPSGLIPTPDDDGGVFVRRVDPTVPLTGPLVCDWRSGDVW